MKLSHDDQTLNKKTVEYSALLLCNAQSWKHSQDMTRQHGMGVTRMSHVRRTTQNSHSQWCPGVETVLTTVAPSYLVTLVLYVNSHQLPIFRDSWRQCATCKYWCPYLVLVEGSEGLRAENMCRQNVSEFGHGGEGLGGSSQTQYLLTGKPDNCDTIQWYEVRYGDRLKIGVIQLCFQIKMWSSA